ncbi:MAG: acetyl-CoA carboxylase biotin carboxyl carrier protein subunit [Pedobacter sp.]|nr:MAG: acetyl-CoA carboxylase biotin carboxyl carrier protein subunit [Pedobacter sp.]
MNVKVKDSNNYTIEVDHDEVFVDQQKIAIDYRTTGSNHTHIIYNNTSYSTEIVSIDRFEKTISVKVNGNLYSVSLEDQYDLLLKQMGLDILHGNKIQEVKAPMPGLVLKVLVDAGSVVMKGDSLLILEAMKMENMIKSPTDGTIKKVFITTGDKVEKSEILIQFE